MTAVERCSTCTGRVVAPGFIDPHGHSDGSLFLDGALASHLHQGYTTQLSGNCGDTLAPITDAGRELVELSLRAERARRALGDVRRVPRPGRRSSRSGRTSRSSSATARSAASVIGRGRARAADRRRAGGDGRARSRRRSTPARSGLSTGLIYAPGHARRRPTRSRRWWRPTARRGGLYATHMRNECDGLFASLDESIAAVRAAGLGRPAPGLAPQVRLAARSGAGPARRSRVLEAARAEGLDVAADQYPYTAAATTLATILPPALQALGVDAVRRRPRRPARPRPRPGRDRARASRAGRTWPPTRAGTASRISYAASRPEWAGRSLAELADELHADPADLAFDALVADRLDVSVVIDCMSEPDVETIMAVPWIAVCTDAEGRRPGHPILDAGRPHPRTYGSTARVLGHVRARARRRCRSRRRSPS